MARKSYKEKYNSEDGVWRTIGGRRVFIRTGQSLSSAMRESGKFERLKKDKEHFIKMDRDLRRMQKQAQDDFDRDFDKARKLGSDKLELEAKENRDKIVGEINKERYRLANEWREREKGKEYIDDYPEAYRHYERDSESTQWINDSTDLRKEFGLSKQDYPDEKDYMPGGKKWNPEWASARESKVSQERLSKLKKEGNSSVRNYNQVDKEWTDLAKKMEKDYDEFGTTNWKDEKRLNELSAERDRLSVYDDDYEKYKKMRLDDPSNYTDEQISEFNRLDSKYLEQFSKEPKRIVRYRNGFAGIENGGIQKEFSNIEEAKQWYELDSKDYDEPKGFIDKLNEHNKRVIEKHQKTGNDYLPKASKITTQGTSNRKEVSDNIQAHILEYYDNPVDFMEQMDAMDYLPTRWRAGEEIARGGSYLIYNGDMAEFLDSLGINPKGKTFSEDKSFDMYTSLVGRESERLYNKLEKLYEQYKKEHKDSDATLDDFRKWFK